MSLQLLPDPAAIARAAELIESADAIIIAAGAGMGVDSGLPDFRGNEGFWKAYPALARARLEFTRIASPSAFERNPQLAWGFYGHRLKLYRDTRPHTGFGILKGWGESKPNGWAVFTSNVDGQFQKAGFTDDPIDECHGSIHHLQCLKPCCNDIWPANGFEPEIDHDNCLLLNAPPTCPRCGGLARPNILMFDDWQWNSDRSDVQRTLLDRWLDSAQAPLVVEIGAGRAIATVRHFSQRMQQRGSPLIRINLHEANIHNPDAIELALGAQEALAALQQHLAG